MRKEYGLFLKILWLGGYVDCICEACKDDMEEKLDVWIREPHTTHPQKTKNHLNPYEIIQYENLDAKSFKFSCK
jgi:hypothetical protein